MHLEVLEYLRLLVMVCAVGVTASAVWMTVEALVKGSPSKDMRVALAATATALFFALMFFCAWVRDLISPTTGSDATILGIVTLLMMGGTICLAVVVAVVEIRRLKGTGVRRK